MKSKINDSGFIHTVLVIITAGAIAGVGWYVWRSKNASNNIPSNDQSVPVTKIESSGFKEQGSLMPQIPSDWRLYENKEAGFSFWHPPKWGEIRLQESPTGSVGTTLSGYFTNYTLPKSVGFTTLSKPWGKAIDGPPLFGHFLIKDEQAVDYYTRQYRNDDKLIGEIKPTKIIHLEDGDKALVLGGQERLDWYRKIIPTPENQPFLVDYEYEKRLRTAYINFSSSYKEFTLSGFEFMYREIPTEDTDNFDLMVSSFKKL